MKLLPLLLLLALSAGATPKTKLWVDGNDKLHADPWSDGQPEVDWSSALSALPNGGRARGFTDPREHPDEFACEFIINQFPWNRGHEIWVLLVSRTLVCLDGAPVRSIPEDGGTP